MLMLKSGQTHRQGKLIHDTIQMMVSEGVGKKIVTKVEHCTTRPLLGCYFPSVYAHLECHAFWERTVTAEVCGRHVYDINVPGLVRDQFLIISTSKTVHSTILVVWTSRLWYGTKDFWS